MASSPKQKKVSPTSKESSGPIRQHHAIAMGQPLTSVPPIPSPMGRTFDHPSAKP